MKIQDIRHDFPKNAGYTLTRPHGRNYYIFAHYSGPVTLQINNKTFQINTGGCVLLFPNTPHYLYSEGPLVHDWIHIYASDIPLEDQYSIPINEPFYIPEHEQISEKFRRIEAEFFSKEPMRDTLLDAYCTEFFLWLHRHIKSPGIHTSIPQTMESNMTALRRRILSHPQKNYSVEQMASMLSISTSRFHAVYKILFGSTPYQDMIAAKVEQAKALLLSQPDMTLKAVAEALSYSDQYHFIRQFKSVVGKTPGQYRKSHEKDHIHVDYSK